MKIGLLGYGTVGSGVYALIESRKKMWEGSLTTTVEVTKILVNSLKKEREGLKDKNILTTDAQDILNDSEISVVIELIGGEMPALEYIKTALKNHKHVITGNKKIISRYFLELNQLATENDVQILYEASV